MASRAPTRKNQIEVSRDALVVKDGGHASAQRPPAMPDSTASEITCPVDR